MTSLLYCGHPWDSKVCPDQMEGFYPTVFKSDLPVAIVGCRPYSENRLIKVPLVALHDQLVGATDHRNIVHRPKL